MIQINRPRISPNENVTHKLQLTTTDTNRFFTSFEDLANEIIYEIFDFLDAYHIYEVFHGLNTRFCNLLFNSNFPLRIDTLFVSKVIFFHRYYTQFIEPNIHRIYSLHLSNLSVVELLSLLLQNIPRFTRLKRLILDDIRPTDLENLLHGLISSPCLSSLTITSNGPDSAKDTLYRAIFQLPVLKYCKMVFSSGFGSGLLPMLDNKYSPIEYLVMKGECKLDFLAAILSYVPQLRRLSINYPSAIFEVPEQIAKVFSTVANHLTHASLRLDCLKFNQFVPLVTNLFRNLQVLEVSTSYGQYLDGHQWEQLISSYMPHLRIFDIEYTDFVLSNGNSRNACQTLTNQFNSPFWLERQWFFAHRQNWGAYSNRGVFYSTKPYRRKYYIISGEYDQDSCMCNEEHDFNTVRYVDIRNEQAMIDCLIFFPNATKLTISTSFHLTRDLLTTHLDRIVPLAYITVLIINHQGIPFEQLTEIVLFMSNCHTLTLSSILYDQNDLILPVGYYIFRSISKKSNIKNINITNKYTFETIDLLARLCSRVEYMRITLSDLLTAPIVQFLLSKTNVNTRHLSSLRFVNLKTEMLKELKTLIKTDKLLDSYVIKVISDECYLWW